MSHLKSAFLGQTLSENVVINHLFVVDSIIFIAFCTNEFHVYISTN